MVAAVSLLIGRAQIPPRYASCQQSWQSGSPAQGQNCRLTLLYPLRRRSSAARRLSLRRTRSPMDAGCPALRAACVQVRPVAA